MYAADDRLGPFGVIRSEICAKMIFISVMYLLKSPHRSKFIADEDPLKDLIIR